MTGPTAVTAALHLTRCLTGRPSTRNKEDS